MCPCASLASGLLNPSVNFVTPTRKVYLQTLQRIEGGSGSKMFQFIEFQLLMRTFEEQYKFKILN